MSNREIYLDSDTIRGIFDRAPDGKLVAVFPFVADGGTALPWSREGWGDNGPIILVTPQGETSMTFSRGRGIHGDGSGGNASCEGCIASIAESIVLRGKGSAFETLREVRYVEPAP